MTFRCRHVLTMIQQCVMVMLLSKMMIQEDRVMLQQNVNNETKMLNVLNVRILQSYDTAVHVMILR